MRFNGMAARMHTGEPICAELQVLEWELQKFCRDGTCGHRSLIGSFLWHMMRARATVRLPIDADRQAHFQYFDTLAGLKRIYQ